MSRLKLALLTACLGAPAAVSAQEPILVHDGFATVGENSAAPQPYGWQLPPVDAGVWESITIEGEEHLLRLSDLFLGGGALGRTAATWQHSGSGRTPVFAGEEGPFLTIYLNGLVAVRNKGVAAPDVAQLNGLRQAELNQLNNVPDLFAPLWGETEPYSDGGACPDAEKNHAVFFYASRLDPNAAPGAPERMVVTWHQVLPAGDCDAAPNTFQMVVTQLPGETEPEGRPPVRVEFNYGDCGWSVPDQDELGDPDGNPIGARAGLLFNSGGAVGGALRRGMEVLGARELNFEVELLDTDADGMIDGEGTLHHERRTGASGDPLRVGDYCVHSNRADWQKGLFSFELGNEGRPAKDDDHDGVPEGPGGHDNCPNVANPYQGNVDEDLFGDACDHNADDDNLTNTQEFCDLVGPSPFLPYPQDVDSDGDGLGDGCDFDLDGDDVHNLWDNCPEVSNPLQFDLDRNGEGYACDAAEVVFLLQVLPRFRALLANGATMTMSQQSLTMVDEMPDKPGPDESFIDAWAAASNKEPALIRAVIDEILSIQLSSTEEAAVQQVALELYAETNEEQFLGFYYWSKSNGLSLASFLEKHGATWFPKE